MLCIIAQFGAFGGLNRSGKTSDLGLQRSDQNELMGRGECYGLTREACGTTPVTHIHYASHGIPILQSSGLAGRAVHQSSKFFPRFFGLLSAPNIDSYRLFSDRRMSSNG